ncbi:MAG TPA: aminodeoxychorismate/anthranilate synthase component II [Gammaproteobacteria bacterium]|nr:aminodeoxychorismate/anthranilate synthase component II [Gammaproteobacteria bacterium]
MIDNYDSFTYNLYQMVAQIDKQVEVLRNDKISVADIATLKPKAIILSPGPGRPDDAGICLEVIHTYSGVIPILGVCLGHQAIVQAFGGKIIQADYAMHGKISAVLHTQRGIFAHMPMPFNAGRYHSLIAESSSLPQVLTVEAHTSDGIIMGIAHKQHLTFGVQFHPESILTSDGHTLMKNFLMQGE